MSKFLGLDRIKLDRSSSPSQVDVQPSVENDGVAVIGIGCRFGRASNPEQFWNSLRMGEDCIRELPVERQLDLLPLLRSKGMKDDQIRFRKAAYLDEIDKFDPHFFRLSPKEAGLMDPNQRLFLQACWEAIEDAGYGGESIAGSRTGVFVGFSSDFGEEYKRMIKEIDPSLMSLATVGNIKSVIASRIAYLLNLSGPSMLVDTACSSSLMAVHLACQSLRRGECDMALAGGVKIVLLALDDGSNELGILSADGRTRAFDQNSDGTGVGEGVGTVLLKPLKQALADGDPIYAVIKGGAANQDGASAGLTAPNSIAQQEVIAQAWMDAKINPNTITYVEAHGTGTKLGDPVEIDGLERAFRPYTDKHQFCAIGSVKTNIGHTDHVAGIAGLIKVILSLQHKQLPPHLHFQSGNRNIQFEASPIYVNDKLAQWESEFEKRRAGISSFGLSGTNVHLILEEAPTNVHEEIETDSYGIVTLSAVSDISLKELLNRYQSWLEKQSDHLPELRSICLTTNIGRGHYSHRVSIVCRGMDDFITKINILCESDLASITHPDIHYGCHKPISHGRSTVTGTVQFEDNIAEINNQADLLLQLLVRSTDSSASQLRQLGRLFVQGANVRWKLLYKFQQNNRVHLPVYPFERKRCWPDVTVLATKIATSHNHQTLVYGEPLNHPLLHACMWDSSDQALFVTQFQVKDWILKEHKLFGKYVIPGTAYLEMALKAGQAYRHKAVTQLQDFVFLEPIILEEDGSREVQSLIRREGEHIHFKVTSKRDGELNYHEHAQGKLVFGTIPQVGVGLDLARMHNDADLMLHRDDIYTGNIEESYGPRFKNMRTIWIKGNQSLCHLVLDNVDDLQQYRLHPGLMDSAVGSMVYSGILGNELYLPFAYKNMVIYEALPNEIYCECTRTTDVGEQAEVIKFNLLITDLEGKLLARVDEYTVKRVNDSTGRRLLDQSEPSLSLTWEFAWKRASTPNPVRDSQGVIAVFRYPEEGNEWLERVAEKGLSIVDIQMDGSLEQSSFDSMVAKLLGRNIQSVLFIAPTYLRSGGATAIKADEELIMDVLYLSRSLINERLKDRIELFIVTENAYKVTGDELFIVPRNRAILSLGNVINQEHKTLRCYNIDIDSHTDIIQIINHEFPDLHSPVAYRNGNQYVMELNRVGQVANTQELLIRNEGVYVITGGMGGIGLEIATCLAAMEPQVNIALLSRTAFPERDQWDDIVATSPDVKQVSRIQRIRNLEAAGASIRCCSVDVSDSNSMHVLFSSLRQQFSRIHGIIHSAGVAGDGFMFRKETSVFRNVLLPKVAGVRLLDQLTEDDELDFFVVFSSITGWLGGVGQGDYAAANSYLDAFAEERSMRGKPTLAIAWSAWRETGMAVDHGAVNEQSYFKPLNTAAALQVFKGLLTSPLVQVTVGEINYDRIGEMGKQLPILLSHDIQFEVDKRASQAERRYDKITDQLKVVLLSGKREEEYTTTEQKLADIWGDILGIEELNVHDNFFDLGGDSIIAVKLSSHILHHMKHEIDVTDIFNYLTVAELAQFMSDSYKAELGSNPGQIIELAVQTQSATKVDIQKESTGLDLPASMGRYDFANHLSWRQFNCYDRSLALMMADDDLSLIQHFKLFLGMKRGFNMNEEGYPFEFRSQDEVQGFPSDNELLKMFGYRVHIEKVNDMQHLHSSIARYLEVQKSVMVSFDEFYTFYTPFYLREHTDHLTVLTDFDEKKQLYTMINHNHLARIPGQKINFEPFVTTYQTMEDIYASLPVDSRCILVLERVDEDEATLRLTYKQELMRLLLALKRTQDVGREVMLLLSMVERGEMGQGNDKVELSELFVSLGGKELWVQTLLESYTNPNDEEQHRLGREIIDTSNRLVNQYTLSKYRGRRMAKAEITAAIEELRPSMLAFIQRIIDFHR